MDKRQPADNNKAYYYHFDGLGSVVALSNSNGDSCQSYEYSAYGQVAASDPNFLANPYMFTGRRFDIETGLYYYRARYYNPHIGRFMQTDPIGYGYGYCGNNPLAFVDPSGLIAISFYDPDDPGIYVSSTGEILYGASTGDQFKESSDDWGEHSYAMTSARDVIMKIAELQQEGEKITEIYFHDHSLPLISDQEKIEGLQFGEDGIDGGLMRDDRGDGHSNLEIFMYILAELTPDSTMLHFRQCNVAMGIEEGGSLLEDLANWSNRFVTGSDVIIVDESPVVFQDDWEVPGPDYYYPEGRLWQAFTQPDGNINVSYYTLSPY